MRMLVTSNPAICRFMLTRALIGLGALLLFTICPERGLAQQGVDSSTTLSSAETARIVAAFTAKEAEFRRDADFGNGWSDHRRVSSRLILYL